MNRSLILLFIGLLLTAYSCKTAEPVKKSEESVPVIETTEKSPEKPIEKEKEPEPAAPLKESTEFVLDEATYKKTKEDLSNLIATLNSIIARKDYDTWLTYLTKDYFDYYSDPEILKEQSDSPLLKKYKIVLRSLKDYFNYVVVGSRKNVRLDEIKAIDENHIKAYMYIDNTPVIIYELVNVNGNWKITHF